MNVVLIVTAHGHISSPYVYKHSCCTVKFWADPADPAAPARYTNLSFLLLLSNAFSVIRLMTKSFPTQSVTQHFTVQIVVKEC